MLCYVMLCYVMLCYVMLCYVMLCYVMLCYVMLCYAFFQTEPGNNLENMLIILFYLALRETYGGVEKQLTSSLTLVLVGCEWSASCSDRFISRYTELCLLPRKLRGPRAVYLQ